MLQEPNISRIEITIGDNKSSWETPHRDVNAEDIINAFYGLCVAHTWMPSSILHAMKSFAEEHLPYVDADYTDEE